MVVGIVGGFGYYQWRKAHDEKQRKLESRKKFIELREHAKDLQQQLLDLDETQIRQEIFKQLYIIPFEEEEAARKARKAQEMEM